MPLSAEKDWLKSVLPADTGCHLSETLPESADLVTDELASTDGMVAKRLREFTHGRYCARQALADIGEPGVAIPKAADRSPVWLERIVGSITHCQDAAAAAVSLRSRLRGLGIDMETSEALCQEAMTRLEAIHPYSMPKIVALAEAEVNAAYLAWLREVTAPSTDGG